MCEHIILNTFIVGDLNAYRVLTEIMGLTNRKDKIHVTMSAYENSRIIIWMRMHYVNTIVALVLVEHESDLTRSVWQPDPPQIAFWMSKNGQKLGIFSTVSTLPRLTSGRRLRDKRDVIMVSASSRWDLDVELNSRETETQSPTVLIYGC